MPIYFGQKRFYARSLSDNTDMVTIQRSANYGNIGPLKKDYLDPDDAYLFPAKVADRLLDTATQVTQQFGYDFYFDASGQATIGSRNNPQSWTYFSTNADTVPPQKTDPAAVGGRYYRNLVGVGAPGWSKVFSAHCSRVDLFVGIGWELAADGSRTYNGGVFKVNVAQRDTGGGWSNIADAEITIDTYDAIRDETFFYDDAIRADGTNSTVFTVLELPFAEYQITITPVDVSPSDTNVTAVVRLNGAAIYERNPNATPYPAPLSTTENLFDITPSSNEKDLRNQIIVVGQRRASVTDSAKFFEAGQNNPFTEFVVSVSADPGSLYDAEADNFVGGKRVAVIIDEKVTDSDFARWLARTALYRFNTPKLDANIKNSVLPVVELRDPLSVIDVRDELLPFTVWVKGFQERWGLEDSETTLELTSYQELPSYTPREDLDIVTLFRSSPADELEVQYKNLFGENVVNPPLPNFQEVARQSLPILDAGAIKLPQGAYADDVFLYRNFVPQDNDPAKAISSNLHPDKNILINTPYRHFWNVGSDGRTLNFDFQEGDGTPGIYDKPAYKFPVDWHCSFESFNKLPAILSANEPDFSDEMWYIPTGGRDGGEYWQVLTEPDPGVRRTNNSFSEFYPNDGHATIGSQVHVFPPTKYGRLNAVGVCMSLNMNSVTLTTGYRILSFFGATLFPYNETLPYANGAETTPGFGSSQQNFFMPPLGDVTVTINTDRKIQIQTNDGSGRTATSTTALSASGWTDHLEVQVFAHPSRGYIKVRHTPLPGGSSTVICQLTDVNTQGITHFAGLTQDEWKFPIVGVRIGQQLTLTPDNGAGIQFGDVICYNMASLDDDGYIGPAKVSVVRPVADGTFLEGTVGGAYPDGGYTGVGNRWKNLAELGGTSEMVDGDYYMIPGAPDGDFSYISFDADDDPTPSQPSASFVMDDITTAGNILSVRPFYLVGIDTDFVGDDTVPPTDVTNSHRMFLIADGIRVNTPEFSIPRRYAIDDPVTAPSPHAHNNFYWTYGATGFDTKAGFGFVQIKWALRHGWDVDPRTSLPWTDDGVDGLVLGWQQMSSRVETRLSTLGLRVVHNANALTSGTVSTARKDNVFYDPYTSESGIGNLVDISFDSLISGYYRVSLWAVSPNGEFDFPVAYLTKPEAAASDDNAHWVYMEAAAHADFTWDGTDSVGLWNRYQSRQYAKAMEGSFGEQPLGVGSGFFVWNDQSVSPYTAIGDDVPENYDENNRPYYTKGRYSRFYVKVEAKSDRLLRKGIANTLFTTNSHNDLKLLDNPFYIFTHLGEPTQIKIHIDDWEDSFPLPGYPVTADADPTKDWTQTTTLDRWHRGINDSGDFTSLGLAQVRNGKPVKITFSPVPRRGILFRDEDGNPDPTKVSVQVVRDVHVKINVFDQFWTFTGKPWDSDQLHTKNKAENNQYNRDAKRITSRMYTDDGNSIEFAPGDWLSGHDLEAFDWIFQPNMFEKDFGAGVPEVLRYGDYEQLYSLPGFDTKQGGGTARTDRAYITLAFINYLFYLSAHTLDRSGRRQHCINTDFIDKSKIVSPDWLAATTVSKPEYKLDYERFDAEYFLSRSIICRQWVEPGWSRHTFGMGINSPFYQGSPADQFHPGTGGMLEGDDEPKSAMGVWLQPSILDFNPLTTTAITYIEDLWMKAYMTDATNANADFWQAWTHKNSESRKTFPVHNNQYLLRKFGAWHYDRGGYVGLFTPSPCRDFMPYWKLPGMPDWGTPDADIVLPDTGFPKVPFPGDAFILPLNEGQNILEIPASMNQTLMRDIARQANWFGFAYADNYEPTNLNKRGARLEVDVILYAHGEEKGPEMAKVYDYVRQDSLNRFDMFRGVFSRAPLAKIDDVSRSPGGTGFWRTRVDTTASVQPVKPSGAYMLNLGNYSDYIVGPPTALQRQDRDTYLHMTQHVENFHDIRFRHEYVWYSSHYFPVYPQGGAKYWDFRKLASTAGVGPKMTEYYDEGAWIGHKDDVTALDWTADPHLRWSEIYGWYDSLPLIDPQFTHTGYKGAIFISGEPDPPPPGSTIFRWPMYSGGYAPVPAEVPPYEGVVDVGSFDPTGAAEAVIYLLGERRFMKRGNFFADVYSSHRLRLAVGPRVPQTRSLIMNLTLPTGLSGLI